jgi:hypothetical protein
MNERVNAFLKAHPIFTKAYVPTLVTATFLVQLFDSMTRC